MKTSKKPTGESKTQKKTQKKIKNKIKKNETAVLTIFSKVGGKTLKKKS